MGKDKIKPDRTSEELNDKDRNQNKDILKKKVNKMDLQQLKEELYTNDISFEYKDKNYVINPMDKFYAGEAENNEDGNQFDTFKVKEHEGFLDGEAK